MSNEFFTKSGNPASGSAGASSTIRNEFLSIEQAFDKLPALTGNGSKLVRINAAGNALEATASPTTATQSKTDSSTLLANLDFVRRSFGCASTSGTLDWNDASNTMPGVGTTLLLGDAANGPGDSDYYYPLNFAYSTFDGKANTTQIAVGYSVRRLWMRTRTSDTWSAWVRVYTSSTILGTVSQSGGVPTGAIIEKGSNDNGTYTKFADGTMVCTYSASVTDQACSTDYAPLYHGTRSWTYPHAFISEPVVAVPLFKWGTGASWGGVAGGVTTSSVTLRIYDVASRASGTSTLIGATAIGRWF